MMQGKKFHGGIFILGAFAYLVASYLLLLKDPFLLEQLGLALKLPAFETFTLNLAKVLHVNYSATLIFGLSLVLLIYGYLTLLKHTRAGAKFPLAPLIIALIFIFLSFPALSTDIFDYNNSNRVAFVYRQNPWTTPPINYPQDQSIYLGNWLKRPSIYPPVMFIYSAIEYFIFGSLVLLVIIGFKTLNLILYGLVLYILHRQLGQNRYFNLALFALNPLVLIEFIGNGHNDLVMGLGILLSCVYWLKNRPGVSGFFLGLAIMAKISALINLPVIFISCLFKAKLRLFILLITGLLISLVLISLPLLPSLGAILATVQIQTKMYYHSLPYLFNQIGLLLTGSPALANLIEKAVSLTLFSLSWWLISGKKKSTSTVALICLAYMLYLLLVSSMFQAWYLIWFLVLIPIIPDSRIKTAGIVFSLTALLHYLIYYLSLYFNPLAFDWQIIIWFSFAAAPLYYLIRKPPGSLLNKLKSTLRVSG